MIVTTTTAIGGRPVTEYVGVVTGEVVLGTNVFRDLFAGLRDIVGTLCWVREIPEAGEGYGPRRGLQRQSRRGQMR